MRCGMCDMQNMRQQRHIVFIISLTVFAASLRRSRSDKSALTSSSVVSLVFA